jgi:hypothetical protein
MTALSSLRLADVREEWDWLSPIIDRMKGKLTQQWRREDVYAALRYDQSRLFVSTINPQKAFFVVMVKFDEFTCKPYLFVWLGYCADNCGNEFYYPDLRQIAKDFNCETIQFSSPRQGWERRHTDIVKKITLYQIAV